MSHAPSGAADNQLDALIARIHGLSGSVRSGRGETPPDARDREARELDALSTDATGLASMLSAASEAHLAPRDETTPHDDRSTPASFASPNAPTRASVISDSPAIVGNLTPRVRSAEKGSTAGLVTFRPSRDEPWRPEEPQTLEEAGARESTVEHILMRYLLARGEVEGRQTADQLKLPFRLVEPILERLKRDQTIAHKRGTATGDYVYVLSENGRSIARNYNADCTYYGACPVPLDHYIHSVRQQTVEGQQPRKSELLRAFSDLLINPAMLDRLGPAVNSGRGMFLFGYPGNGKTSIAERVTAAFGKYVWIPRAIDIDGDILRVFDPMNHVAEMPESDGGLLDVTGYDKRWVRIRRPTIVAGGELTMDMLEVQCSPETNISEAPLQLKSNCGTLVIDDFGRQKMSVDQLLNRWIVPLEKRFDYLNMSSGKKIQVPFDQLVVFSTNLEPKDLVDDAFLRRIPYKIEVTNPSEEDFRKLFGIMCKVLKIPYRQEPIDYVVETHYKPINRPFRNCQPRDLLLQVRNYCLYHDRPVELKNEYFDFAVENYFSVM